MSSLQLTNAIRMSQNTSVNEGFCRNVMEIGIQFMSV